MTTCKPSCRDGFLLKSGSAKKKLWMQPNPNIKTEIIQMVGFSMTHTYPQWKISG